MILHNVSKADYLTHPYDGSTGLRMILQSPADYRAYKSQPKIDTAATTWGTIVHCLLLEPSEFDKRYAIQPADWGPLNKLPGSRLWKEFKAENAHKQVIKADDARELLRIRNAACDHVQLQRILKGAITEVTAYDDDNELKACADCIDTDGVIWDIKTTSKGLHDEDLAWTVFKGGYHFQAVHQTHVFKKKRDIRGWGWVFISTDTPAIHILPRRANYRFLAEAQKDFDWALEKRNWCRETNQWPGYGDDITEIYYPISKS